MQEVFNVEDDKLLQIVARKDIIIPKGQELTLTEMHNIMSLLPDQDYFEYFDMFLKKRLKNGSKKNPKSTRNV